MGLNSYTAPLEASDLERLRQLLIERGFELGEKAHAHFSASKGKLHVTVYQKGPKVLVQGKETEEFVRYVLEPEILGEAKLGYEETLQPEMFEPHFGVDESGKGDFFGPLVVAGVYTDASSTRALMDAGVMDSKRIKSKARIFKLSQTIREVPGVATELVSLGPERYNAMYSQVGNLNRLLAWGHVQVIASLQRQVPACRRSLSDQFARADLLESEARRERLNIKLEQRTRAESDVAVAAASILARERFLQWIDGSSEKSGIEIPLGCGAGVLDCARELVARYGESILAKVGKIHFKTASEI